MVVDCGGGTVDITVHEVSNKEGHIKEVFKATGGPYGSTSGNITYIDAKACSKGYPEVPEDFPITEKAPTTY